MSLVAISEFLALIRRYEEMAEWLRRQQDAARDKGAAEEIARVCQREVGLPFAVVQSSSPEDVLALLRQGANPEGRALVLAELLMLEAGLLERAEDVAGQMRASLQAFCLLGEARDVAPPEACATLDAKFAELGARLEPLCDDPYVAQKLGAYPR